ncbi:hypothetical protein BJF92_12025 [Rhizobium rhizosphaerae]|uniref:Uncharacterized protein n=2 Tax=Xaviernesmea rhizosphaerae TaxID=1672749 RepID=A0A1Q9AN43_9HYPH|nr:hypothetical protein BJF92_12025 [Xaviernesmea rhizosphaerae]
MPAESVVLRDWHAGVTPVQMAARYGVARKTVMKYLAARTPFWRAERTRPLIADERRILVEHIERTAQSDQISLISLPRNSMHLAQRRDSGTMRGLHV